MIKIDYPKIIAAGENKVRLSCDIYVDSEKRNIWFETDKEYEEYLCTERSDAFLIGLLPISMRFNHDIECCAPVTDELLYNIKTYLIPLVAKNAKALFPINIKADIAPSLENAGCVGTGCSCGVDSLNTILTNLNSEYPNCKLTHLTFFNVGAFAHMEKNQNTLDVIEYKKNITREVANKLGLKALITDSNLADVVNYEYYFIHTYSSMFAVYCLQKLWKTYFYASTYDFSHFSLFHNDFRDVAYTELLTLNCFSHRKLRIYSEGAQKTRLEKTQFIADSELAQNYLHVCIYEKENCSKCIKCKRTMNSLYAIGKLDKFSKVFDIEYYKKHKDIYFTYIYELHLRNDIMTMPEYEVLKNEIPKKIKIKCDLKFKYNNFKIRLKWRYDTIFKSRIDRFKNNLNTLSYKIKKTFTIIKLGL